VQNLWKKKQKQKKKKDSSDEHNSSEYTNIDSQNSNIEESNSVITFKKKKLNESLEEELEHVSENGKVSEDIKRLEPPELKDDEIEQLRMKYKANDLSPREEQQILKKRFVIVKTQERLKIEKEEQRERKRKEKELEKKKKEWLSAMRKKMEEDNKRKS